jgi:FtsH-binding integral membrane protein
MPENEANRNVVRTAAVVPLAMANLTVPFCVLLRRNVNHMSDAASIWSAWIFAAVMAAIVMVSAYVQFRRANRNIPRNLALMTVTFMVLSGFFTTIWILIHPSV